MTVKKKDILLLILYCVPWIFLTLYGDWAYGMAWQYGLILALMAVGAGVLGENGKALMMGNILSLGCSLLMVKLAGFDQLNHYFKPFTAYGWVAVLTGLSGMMQMLVWKKQHKDSKY